MGERLIDFSTSSQELYSVFHMENSASYTWKTRDRVFVMLINILLDTSETCFLQIMGDTEGNNPYKSAEYIDKINLKQLSPFFTSKRGL